MDLEVNHKNTKHMFYDDLIEKLCQTFKQETDIITAY